MNDSVPSYSPHHVKAVSPQKRNASDMHTSSLSHELSASIGPNTSASTSDHRDAPYCTSTSASPSESLSSSPLTPSYLTDDSSITDMSSETSPASNSSNRNDKTVVIQQPAPTYQSIEVSPSTPSDGDDNLRFGPASDNSSQSGNARKRPKNLKNLAVKTSTASTAPVARALPSAAAHSFGLAPPPQPQSPSTASTLSINSQGSSARRRPSNLSLITATSSVTNSAISPPEGGQTQQFGSLNLARPNLRHFQSSPSLPLFESASPGIDAASATPSSSLARPLLERSHSAHSPIKEEEYSSYDLPLSREEKPEAYPDGPICIMEPNLDLYLEPTAKQARAYDVVINVASEVRNPFLSADKNAPVDQSLRIDGGGGIQKAPRRNRDSDSSFVTAIKESDGNGSDDDDNHGGRQPEYIHIQWEHNSDVVPELPGLVRLIDDRIMRGLRVLVHCQCGVSRSATLVVAYCMYKRPQATVQEAYDEVKRRSKWIGPNMNLIMQLQEFRSNLTGKATSRRLTSGFRGAVSPVDSSTSRRHMHGQRPVLHVDSSHIERMQPKTAPLQAGVSPQESMDEQVGSAITPGPSSAPSGVSWPITGDSVETSSPARTASVPYRDDASYDDMTSMSPSKQRPHSFRFDSSTAMANLLDVSPVASSPRTASTSRMSISSKRSTQNFSLPLRRYAEQEGTSMVDGASAGTTKHEPPAHGSGLIADVL